MSDSRHLLACAILLAIGHTISAEYDVDAYCTLVKDNTKLASIDSCSTFYTCKGGKATQQSCASNQAYDKNKQSCELAANVNCFYDVAEPCTDQDATWVPQVGTCNGWIYCLKGKEAGKGTCSNGQIFSNGKCIYGTCSDDSTGEGGNADMTSVCQVVPNGIWFGSTVTCKKWQKCDADRGLLSGDCPNDLVLNVQTQICDHEVPSVTCTRVTGVEIQPGGDDTPQACTADEEATKKASDTTCSVYFTCTKLVWVKSNCAKGLFWDVAKEECVARQAATPSATCNRCEGFSRAEGYVNAVDTACQKYTRCSNGKAVSSGTCAKGYFDEAAQGCVNDDETDYAKENGACSTTDGGETPPEQDCVLDSEAKCSCSDTTVTSCTCGLDATAECVDCGTAGVDETGNCNVAVEPDCVATCGALTSATCAATDDCTCGLNDGACSDCKDATTCDDCKKSGDLTACAESETCIVTDEKCVYCAVVDGACPA